MIDYVLGLTMGCVALAALASGRALLRLDRLCGGVEKRPGCDGGLLRWYAQGFEHWTRITQWLFRASVVLLILSLALHAPTPLSLAAVLTLAVSYAELRFGGERGRRHLRYAYGLSSPRRPH